MRRSSSPANALTTHSTTRSTSNPFFANRWFDYSIILLLWLTMGVLLYLYGAERALITPIFHLDGAFQTASGLFRLADGQLPGRDYFPYLGLGATYLLWPLFWVFGKTLAASQFAAYTAFLASGMISTGILATLLVPRHKILTATIIAALYLCCFLLFCNTVPYILQWVLFIEPGNSLRPIRSFIVYLAGAAIYLTILKIPAGRLCWIALGSIAGIAVLWSNDYGIPTAGITGIFGLWWAYKQQQKCIPAGLWMGITGLIVAAIGLTIATGGHPLALLEYNFVDVTGDQYWYFGAWDEKHRLFSGRDAYKIIFPIGLVGAAGFIWLTLVTLIRPTKEHVLLYAIGWMLLGGGLIATIGGHLDAYFQAYEQLVVLAVLITILRFGWPWLVKHNTWLWQRWQTLPSHTGQQRRVLVGLAVAVLLIIGSRWGYNQYRQKYFAENPAYQFVEEYDGYLHEDWHQHLTFIKQHQSSSVVEEYWGLWGAYTGASQRTPVDSAIHAMGSVRQRFAEYLESKPEYVVTTLPAMSVWATWNVTANWWFYQPLLQGYTPLRTSPTTLVWQRQLHTAIWPEISCRVEHATATQPPAVVLPEAASGFYEVTVGYQADLHSRSLLLMDTGIHKVIHVDGYVSLNTHDTSVTLPVRVTSKQVEGGSNARFDFRLEAAHDTLLGEASGLQLQSCTARKIETTHDYLPKLATYDYWDFADTALILNYMEEDDIPFLLQDKNWQRYSRWERFWLFK